MTGSPTPVVLVTGGSRGIGLATARVLAEDGWSLILAGRDDDRLRASGEALRQAFPDTHIEEFATDVADEGSVRDLFRQVQSRHGRLDGLVNAAGVLHEAPLAMTRSSDLQHTVAVNLYGSYYCCQYAARLMARHRRGAIVNLASAVGEQGAAGQSAYAASKAAVDGMTRSMARELGPQRIRVNAVAPGLIETDMTAAYVGERGRRVIARTALGRAGSAGEVAALIAFLISDRAAYITGQVLAIDGGLTL
jgi:3-oxoacyl-[acyl-carrier protein] reductase